MTWSYSRITKYEVCKYAWLLTYIKNCEKKGKFFAEYGSFIHQIMQKYLTGELKENELVDYYLENYLKELSGKRK